MKYPTSLTRGLASVVCSKITLLLSVLVFLAFSSQSQTIITLAGDGPPGGISGDGGPATAASIIDWSGVAVDGLGNVYITEYTYYRIRKINSAGIISTYVGTGSPGYTGDGGPSTAATIGAVYSVAADAAGNLYLADYSYSRIRKVDPSGIITTIAGTGAPGYTGDGGPATAANITCLYGMTVDGAGNVYFYNWNAWVIRKINAAGTISTVAGTPGIPGFTGDGGPATAAEIEYCYGLAADPVGNLYLSNWNSGVAGSYRVRKVSTAGIISTFAGNGTSGSSGDGGPATAATIEYVWGIAADAGGNVFISDYSANRIRRVDASGIINEYAGTGVPVGFSGDGGPATAAQLDGPYGLAVDGSDNLFICDYFNYRIREVLGRDRPPTFTGGHSISFTVCENTVGDSTNSILAVHDSDVGQTLTWNLLATPVHGTAALSTTALTNGAIVTPTGLYYTPTFGYSGLDSFKMRVNDGYKADTTTVYVTVNPVPSVITGTLSVSTGGYTVLGDSASGGTWSSGSAAIASVGAGTGLVIAGATGATTVTYTLPTGCISTAIVNVFAYAGQTISTVAGNGTSGFTGDGAAATAAELNGPSGEYVDAAGNIYIADDNNNRIRKVSPVGIISTIAGTATGGYSADGVAATVSELNVPFDVVTDGAGNIYISDYLNNRIRKINSSGTISTVAGTGAPGFSGDGTAATGAQINTPTGIALDGSGNLYIADAGNARVRRINTSGIITTIAGTGTAGSGGDGSPATIATINTPMGVCVDGSGNIYIADGPSNKVRRINTAGIISTFAGTGTAGYSGDGTAASGATLHYPAGIVADPLGNVYIGDRSNNAVRKVNASGIISTAAGGTGAGYSGDHCAATAGQLNVVLGLCQDGAGNIYIADFNNTRVRKISYNHAPVFTGGHTQGISMCENSTDSLGALLAITDIDNGQGETWATVTGPTHGTLSSTYSATVAGGTLTPTGQYYVPTIGYTGLDSFIIKVTDCSGGADTTRIVVIVNPPPSAIAGTASVCAGQTTTLSDPVGTGTWSSNTTSVATVTMGPAGGGVVSGVTTGTATITYSPGAGCSVVKVVTVNAAPAHITGPGYVCLGSNATLTDSTAGGTWSSSATVIASVTGGGVVHGAVLGTAVIDYTVAGCPATLTVTVSPLPATISGISSMCAGDDITFLDATTGGTWSTGATAVATAAAGGAVSAVAAGATTVLYTLPTGCATSLPITVYPVPSGIMGSTLVCTGTPVTMSDTTGGGIWTIGTGPGGGSAAIDSFSGVLTGYSSGTAAVSYISAYGCAAATTVTVNGSPSPVVGTTTLCTGSYTYLGDPTTGGTWSSTSTTVATVDTGGVVLGVTGGTAVISYTLSTGCATTDTLTVNTTPTLTGSSAICVGLTTTLGAAPSGGSWSSSNTFVATVTAGGIVHGVLAGTTTISYTTGGCSATKTITVNNSPGIISGTLHVCAGATTGLTDLTGGGTWASSATATATVGSSSGTVGGIIPGTATITYSLGAGCSVSAMMTVNALAPAITGTATVCAASTTTLSDPAVGGGTWSNTSTSVATVASATGSVYGVSAGTAVITFTATTGCTATRIVTVNALPAALTGTFNVCPGATTLLSTTTPGGTWASGTTAVATMAPGSGLVSGVVPGTSVITYTISSGCSRSATVTVNAPPAAFAMTGGGSYCAGGSGVLVGLGGSVTGVSYQLVNGVSVVGAPVGGTGGSLNFGLQAAAGTYTVIATNITTGCSSNMSGASAVVINPLPAAITGPTAVCVSATMAETDASGGGTWSSNTTTVATVTPGPAGGGIVTGVTTGTTTITYTLPTTCAITEVVTVSLSPTGISGPASVCAGTTAILSDAVSGGSWTSSSTATATVGSLTGMVSGAVPGTVTITYSLGTGCTVTKAMTVSPAPSPISGTTAVCIGGTTTLSDPTGGGTWTSTTTALATVTAGGMVTGVTTGIDTIIYSHGGCAVWTLVTVNPTPTAISGTGAVCQGLATIFSDGVSGGSWTSSNTAVATADAAGNIGGAGPGTATITYSPGAGCTATKPVTVNAISAIGGATGVCVGATTSLTDAAGGGTWLSGSTAVATITAGGVVTGAATGTSAITYTTPAGCTAATTINVNTAPSAIGGTKDMCVGASGNLSNTATGGLWSSSSTSVATIIAATGVVTGASPGTSIVTYSLGGGCTTFTTVTVNPSPAAISGTAVLCAGTLTPLTDGTPGGSWSSSATTTASVSTTGVVDGLSAGEATITYAPPTGCYAIKQVTVNPLPGLITGTTDICIGLTSALSDGTTGGTWSCSSGIATVTPMGVVTGVSAGTAAIVYTLPAGCAATTTLTVQAAPAAITGAMAICQGATAPLADATAGGAWSAATGLVATVSPSGVITGLALGTETISYMAAGCPATAVVTVNALPAAISGPATVCAGSVISLTDLSAGGTWSSPTGAGIILVDGIGGAVTGESVGTATVTYSMGAGCTVTTQVTVNPLPLPISGASAGTLCVGYTTSLGDPTAGGSWSSSNTYIAVVYPTGLVTGTGGGTASISYTLPTGCSISTPVVINSVPPIRGSLQVCAYGDTVHLSDSLAGGDWSSTLVTVTSSGIVTGFAAGTGTVTYTAPSGCFAVASIVVNPLPAAITGLTNVCVSTSSTLADVTAGGVWGTAGSAIATVNPSGMVTGLAAGTAVISYTLPVTNCKSTATVNVSPLPSPVSGAANVCAGATTTLADTVSGGEWSSSNTLVATIGPATGITSGLATGTATISYYLGAGCAAATTLTVNPLPSVYTTTGGGNYCSGTGGVHIGTGGTDAGITYKLYHAITLEGSLAGTGGSGDFGLETAAGVYKVVAINTATTCSRNMPDSVTVTITPSLVPAVSLAAAPGSEVCQGTAVIFTAGPVNGGSSPAYQWTVNSTAVPATGASYSYTPANGDVVSVQLTSDTACAIPDTASSTVAMTVITPAAAAVTINVSPATIVSRGETVTLTATATGAGTSPSYQWTINGSAVGGATNATFSYAFTGNDTVGCTVSGNGMCEQAGAASVVIMATGVGVQAIGRDESIWVMPNPSKGVFTIRGTLATAGDRQVAAEITDMLGQVVYRTTLAAHNGVLNEQVQLSSTTANGIYLLTLHTDNGSIVFHIVVEQ